VLVVDDQVMVRAGIAAIVDGEPDLTVVGEAGDGESALERAAATRPDVVLMDIRMPGMDGLTATAHLTAAAEPPRVLVLTTFLEDAYVYQALRAGASGFLLKDALPADLLAAVRVIAAGEAMLSPAVTRRLIDRFTPEGRERRPDSPGGRPDSPGGRFDSPGRGPDRPGRRPESPHRRPDRLRPDTDRLGTLTPRERDVLLHVAGGLSNAEIAARLNISLGTVKLHVTAMLGKLGVRDRVQATIVAYDLGLVLPHG
jgi:DNA-binding NarL/FixJ family response regulator